MRLQVDGLACRVGERNLFEDVSFQLGPGETLAVQGPSGAGKTLLLRAIAWLDPIFAGSVTLDGRTAAEWGASQWRAHVTYVPQRPPKLFGTPADFAAAVTRLAAQGGRAGVDPIAIAAGWGLPADCWTRPWASLSGGEQNRAFLAVAVAREPAVLLLDEPTAALDDESVACIEGELRGRRIVWVTHDRPQATRVATRVLEIGW